MVASLPQLPRLRNEARPPKLKRLAVRPTGPKWLSLGTQPERMEGVGPPPPGFVGGTTSLSEWLIYAAIAIVMGDPEDYRRPPFFGGKNWGYQIGTGMFTRQRGSAVVDFVIYLPHETLAIRIQTERFHEGLGPMVQGADALQRVTLGRQFRVVDIIETAYVNDRSGQAAIIEVKRALGLIERPSPLQGGTSQARA